MGQISTLTSSTQIGEFHSSSIGKRAALFFEFHAHVGFLPKSTQNAHFGISSLPFSGADLRPLPKSNQSLATPVSRVERKEIATKQVVTDLPPLFVTLKRIDELADKASRRLLKVTAIKRTTAFHLLLVTTFSPLHVSSLSFSDFLYCS